MKKKSKNPKFEGTMFDINKPSNRRRIEERAVSKPDRSMEMHNQCTLDFANIFNSGFDPLSMPITQELIKKSFQNYQNPLIKKKVVERLVFEFEPTKNEDEFTVYLCGTYSQFQKYGNSKKKRIGFAPFSGRILLEYYFTLATFLQMYYRTSVGNNAFYARDVQEEFRRFAEIKPFDFKPVGCPKEIVLLMEDINDMADMTFEIIRLGKLKDNKWTREEIDIVFCLCKSVMQDFTKITSRFLGI